jgi:glycine cleavage system H protein
MAYHAIITVRAVPFSRMKKGGVMTVILVLVTFLIFAVVDYFLSRGKVPHVALVKVIEPGSEPAFIDGFAVSDKVRYHPGHAWCLQERKHLERVGVDEFAAVLAGPIDKIDLPRPGQWIRQGQKAWGFSRKEEKVEMVSPIEGEVLEVNSEVLKDPSLIRQDPYGRGWLMVVHVPDEENTGRNLLPKSLVPNWIRSAVEALYARQPQLVGATSADGGRPVEDPSATLPASEWRALAGEFFLTR